MHEVINSLPETIVELHRQQTRGAYAEKWMELTLVHSYIVSQIAIELGNSLENKFGLSIDRETITTGTLLHDIGVYQCFDEDWYPNLSAPKYLYHGHLGYELLLKQGFGTTIARFALTHTGTGLTREDIIRDSLKLPQEDVIPISLEEEIICYADKFHTKYPRFSTFEEQRNKLAKFDQSKAMRMDFFRKKFGEPDLRQLHNQFASWHSEMDMFIEEISRQ